MVVVGEGTAYNIFLERCYLWWNVELMRRTMSVRLFKILSGGEVVAEEDEGEEDGEEASLNHQL